MRNHRSLKHHRQRGVTLIELMIVMVVVGILGAIAYPSYQAQMQRTRRADGKATLLNVAQQLERCHTRFNAYDNAGCPTVGALPLESPAGYYSISAEALAVNSFTLRATPQNGQVTDDTCGVLGLTSAGVRTSLNGADDAAGCW
jgi:type IV pilus assembly protein PilE